MSNNANANDAEVFVYAGPRGEQVPDDVVRVRVDPSVTSIPARAFYERKKLAEVELCEGVVEIGESSFGFCDHSIMKINIPTSLKRVGDDAFRGSLQTHIRLHDGIERIGSGAFSGCIFTNFRVPPLITVIPQDMLNSCKVLFSLEISDNTREIKDFRVPPLITVIPQDMLYSCKVLFSLEISDNTREIKDGAFSHCYCLRNVAFLPYADIDNYSFFDDNADYVDNDMSTITDLHRLFGSEAEIIRELLHRFDGLLT
jgi:hypothetical protein